MNINIFFTLLIAGLFMILLLFKPIDMKKQEIGEVPVFELNQFTIKELNNKGLLSILDGTHGLRYKDRYFIKNLDYTDNEDKHLANIKANTGVYKGVFLDLDGNIIYSRNNGFVFRTQKANYNQKTKVLKSPVKYIATMGGHKITGSSMQYNSISQKMKSKNVNIKYKLKER